MMKPVLTFVLTLTLALPAVAAAQDFYSQAASQDGSQEELNGQIDLRPADDFVAEMEDGISRDLEISAQHRGFGRGGPRGPGYGPRGPGYGPRGPGPGYGPRPPIRSYPPRGGGYYPPRSSGSVITCFSQGARGETYSACAYDAYTAQQNALNQCYAWSQYCQPVGCRY